MRLLSGNPKGKHSILNQLRRAFPAENFRAVRDGFGWIYVSDVRTVRTYSQLTPAYDGDDDTFTTVYIDDKGNQLGAGGFIYHHANNF